MNRIHLLTEQVANQIAAGEVVERPASVVKELVENALDAQSRRITVEIQGGGRSLIRVVDDGVGMSRDDALLCLERHATSKIERAEDLTSIGTMGFRGEALPSIASVSRMILTSREQNSPTPEGTQVIINGGKLAEVRAAGSPPGTCLEVRQLFFNLPARRKFLRSEETEYGHIHQYLTLVALAYPQIAFTFIKDGRPVWQLPATVSGADSSGRVQGLAERYKALFGQTDALVPIDFSRQLWENGSCSAIDTERPPGPAPALHVWGLMGKPGHSRATRQDQHLFVNRRPIENRGLNFALLEGYHTALMKGRYPVCTLFLEIDPAEVDVNIHPSKREVKFRHERAVRDVVAEAVRENLLKYHAESAPASRPGNPAAATPVSGRPAAATAEQRTPAAPPTSPNPTSSRWDRNATARPTAPSPAGAASPDMFPQPVALTRDSLQPRPSIAPASPGYDSSRRATGVSIPETTAPAADRPGAALGSTMPAPPAGPASVRAHPGMSEPIPLLQVPLRLVGVVGRLYVVLESDRGLVLLDQHAAHERILFEQMLARMEQPGEASSQRLLLPETVELSVRDALFLREQLQTLTRLGVGLSEFGERTFLLEALPPFVRMNDSKRFVLELLDELKSAGQQVNTLRLGEHVIAKTVCRHAVKANDPLADEELENLVEDLRQCAMPYTCPHGRPTLIEMNYRELEKKFGRLA